MAFRQHHPVQHKVSGFSGFGLVDEQGSLDGPTLLVFGLPATIHDDQVVARSLEEGKHLFPLDGHPDTTVDRFDVRLLLEDARQHSFGRSVSEQQAASTASMAEGEDEDALNEDRYADLDYSREYELQHPLMAPPPREAALSSLSAMPPDSGGSGGGGVSDDDDEAAPLPPPARGSALPDRSDVDSQHEGSDRQGEGARAKAPADGHEDSSPRRTGQDLSAFAYTYAEEQPQDQDDNAVLQPPHPPPRQAVSALGEPPLLAPSSSASAAVAPAATTATTAAVVREEPYVPRFDVPPHLQPHLPTTERIHKILVQTARFVSQNGGQVEVLLRVKQARNPAFGFLLPGHKVFPYYRWVVEARPQELAGWATAAALSSRLYAARSAAAEVPTPLHSSANATPLTQQPLRGAQRATHHLTPDAPSVSGDASSADGGGAAADDAAAVASSSGLWDLQRYTSARSSSLASSLASSDDDEGEGHGPDHGGAHSSGSTLVPTRGQKRGEEGAVSGFLGVLAGSRPASGAGIGGDTPADVGATSPRRHATAVEEDGTVTATAAAAQGGAAGGLGGTSAIETSVDEGLDAAEGRQVLNPLRDHQHEGDGAAELSLPVHGPHQRDESEAIPAPAPVSSTLPAGLPAPSPIPPHPSAHPGVMLRPLLPPYDPISPFLPLTPWPPAVTPAQLLPPPLALMPHLHPPATTAAARAAAAVSSKPARAASPEPCAPGLEDEQPPGTTDAAAAGSASISSASNAAATRLSSTPPADTAAIIDKLVAFVRRNGIKFEATVRAREKGNPRFAFLQPWNPHHAYYRAGLEAAVGADVVAQTLGAVGGTAAGGTAAGPASSAAAESAEGITFALPAASSAGRTAAGQVIAGDGTGGTLPPWQRRSRRVPPADGVVPQSSASTDMPTAVTVPLMDDSVSISKQDTSPKGIPGGDSPGASGTSTSPNSDDARDAGEVQQDKEATAVSAPVLGPPPRPLRLKPNPRIVAAREVAEKVALAESPPFQSSVSEATPPPTSADPLTAVQAAAASTGAGSETTAANTAVGGKAAPASTAAGANPASASTVAGAETALAPTKPVVMETVSGSESGEYIERELVPPEEVSSAPQADETTEGATAGHDAQVEPPPKAEAAANGSDKDEDAEEPEGEDWRSAWKRVLAEGGGEHKAGADDEQGAGLAAVAEEDEEERKRRAAERLERARALLAQRAAAAVARQRAVLHHRHFFLRGDADEFDHQAVDVSSMLEPGELSSLPPPSAGGTRSLFAAAFAAKPPEVIEPTASLPLLSDLVLQASQAAAKHRAAFEASLRDPSQVMLDSAGKPPASSVLPATAGSARTSAASAGKGGAAAAASRSSRSRRRSRSPSAGSSSGREKSPTNAAAKKRRRHTKERRKEEEGGDAHRKGGDGDKSSSRDKDRHRSRSSAKHDGKHARKIEKDRTKDRSRSASPSRKEKSKRHQEPSKRHSATAKRSRSSSGSSSSSSDGSRSPKRGTAAAKKVDKLADGGSSSSAVAAVAAAAAGSRTVPAPASAAASSDLRSRLRQLMGALK